MGRSGPVAAPVASYLVTYNLVITGQTTVTISGLNFAHRMTTATAKVEITECTTTSWTSSTTVHCNLGEGTGTRSVVATVTSLVGTAYVQFTFDGNDFRLPLWQSPEIV